MVEKEFIRVLSIYQAGLDQAINHHAWPSVGQLLHEMARITASFHPRATSENIDKGLAIEAQVTESIREKNPARKAKRSSAK